MAALAVAAPVVAALAAARAGAEGTPTEAPDAGGPEAGAAPWLPPEEESWLRVDSAHFTLFSDASESRTLDLANQLEWFREILTRVHSRLELDFPRPTYVYVLGSRRAWTTCSKAAGNDPDAVAGWFAARGDANYAAISGLPRASGRTSLYHEYTHALLANNLPGLPRWFHEGFAECYGSLARDLVDHVLARAHDPQALAEARRALEEGAPAPPPDVPRAPASSGR